MTQTNQVDPAPNQRDGADTRLARVLVISPCRNEEDTLAATIESMRQQTHLPVQWVIVDDGSTDGTPEILERAARDIPWLHAVRNGDRGFRKLGGGVVDAFYCGLDNADDDYDFMLKLDVDLTFPPRCIERILEYFALNPKLAAASGKVFRPEDGGLVEEHIIDEMVAGCFKFYRRDVFEEIGGFVREVMWDGIDFHRSRLAGWTTRSIDDPDLNMVHHRLMGSTDRSVYRGRFRWGYGQWFMGSAFPYMLASSVFRMRERPVVIGGLCILWGYIWSALCLKPRYDDLEFRRGLRKWQYGRLKQMVFGKKPIPPITVPPPG